MAAAYFHTRHGGESAAQQKRNDKKTEQTIASTIKTPFLLLLAISLTFAQRELRNLHKLQFNSTATHQHLRILFFHPQVEHHRTRHLAISIRWSREKISLHHFCSRRVFADTNIPAARRERVRVFLLRRLGISELCIEFIAFEEKLWMSPGSDVRLTSCQRSIS